MIRLNHLPNRLLFCFICTILLCTSAVPSKEGHEEHTSEEEEDTCLLSTCTEMKKQIMLLMNRIVDLEGKVKLLSDHENGGSNGGSNVGSNGGTCTGGIHPIQHFPEPKLTEEFFDAPFRELLIGAGANANKKIFTNGKKEWEYLITIDSNPDRDPLVRWDLNNLPLPFPDESFDEIHAYEVLEHTGMQGDAVFFFKQFTEFYRILKPGGRIVGTVPKGNWIWGDPSHTRFLGRESFVFLDQSHYIKQVGKTSMSDFRYLYKADFFMLWWRHDSAFSFVLQAVKPSRINMNEVELKEAMQKIEEEGLPTMRLLSKQYGSPNEEAKK